jgi:hypothetical protein
VRRRARRARSIRWSLAETKPWLLGSRGFSIPQLPLTTKTCGENSCKSEPNKNSGNLCALHCAASNADCLPSADPADDQLAPGLPHPISTSATRASEKLCEAVGANLVRGVWCHFSNSKP